MSLPRNSFNCDIPLGSYRDELMKGKETLMANHATARAVKTAECKLSLKHLPNSARVFQFGGGIGGESGDFTKSKMNCEKSKEHELKDRNSASNFERATDVHKYTNSSEELCMRNSQYVRSGKGSHRSNTDCKKSYLDTEPEMMQCNSEEVFYTPMKQVNETTYTTSTHKDLTNDLDSEWEDFTKSAASFKSSTLKGNVTDSLKQHDETNFQLHATPRATLAIEMNYIVFFGLLLSITASKLVQLIYRYFSWFLEQVLHMRNIILGPYSLADLSNLEDSSRLSLRNKIVLLLLISVCSLVYIIMTIFNWILHIPLSQAPKALVAFMHKWHAN